MSRSSFDPPYSGPKALRRALRPGEQFAAWELSGLLNDLDRQRAHIEKVIAGENPRTAAEWLFAMAEGCRQKLCEIKDFDSEFILWWEEDLVVSWIRARQRLRLPADETVALLLAQLRLIDEGASVSESWVNALNPTGLRVLEREYVRRVNGTRSRWVRDEGLTVLDAIQNRLRRRRRRSPSAEE